MTSEELRDRLVSNYPEASQSEIDAMIERIETNPDAEWVKICTSRAIEPGLGNSLDAMNYGRLVEAVEEGQPEPTDREDRFHNAIETLTSIICRSSNPVKTLRILRFAVGLEKRNGITAVDLARDFGVTKQAIIREANQIRKELGLPNALSGGRNEEARDKMRRRNRSNSKLGDAKDKPPEKRGPALAHKLGRGRTAARTPALAV